MDLYNQKIAYALGLNGLETLDDKGCCTHARGLLSNSVLIFQMISFV